MVYQSHRLAIYSNHTKSISLILRSVVYPVSFGMDMVYSIAIKYRWLVYHIATLRLDFYLYIDNDDDCTSVLQHISSLSIPTTSDISDILTLSYVEIILFFYHLSLTSPHNSNRQQIDCTIQYHESHPCPFISSYQRVDTY